MGSLAWCVSAKLPSDASLCPSYSFAELRGHAQLNLNQALTGLTDSSGLLISELVGRSVVVHAAAGSGARIACGTIVNGAAASAMAAVASTEGTEGSEGVTAQARSLAPFGVAR